MTQSIDPARSIRRSAGARRFARLARARSRSVSRRALALGARRRGADRSAGVARSGDPGGRQCRWRHLDRRIFRLQLSVLPQARARTRAGGAGRRQGPAGVQGLADPGPGVGGRVADGAGEQIPGQISSGARCLDRRQLEADRAAHPRTARGCRDRHRSPRSRSRSQTPRRSTPSSRATTIRPPRSAFAARRPLSSANSACRAR